VAKPPHDQNTAASNTYFVTTSADGGRFIFQADRVATLFVTTLFSYREQKKYQLHEFVVMPNHVHLLITPGEGITIEKAMQLIKGGFSFRARKELGLVTEIWQRGYVDHRVRDASDFAQHRQYIRGNPVRGNLANSPEEFRYSSAFPGYELDAAPQGLKPEQ
jgi:putative transposase